jgi:hypothetical protein
MTDFPSYTLGTVSVSNGDVAIVGDGTIWSGVNARSGDTIVIGTSVATIIDVTDDTHLKIDAWPFATVSAGTSYKIIQNSPLRFVGGQAMADVSALIAVLRANGLLWYLPSGYSQPSDVTPALTADDGQAILKIDTGALWVMQGGSWVAAGTFKGFQYKGAYSGATAYVANDIITDGGSAYIVIAAPPVGTAPPNAAYYEVLASKGDQGETGPTPLQPVAEWATGQNYVVGPPASFVFEGGSSYQCLEDHTSGAFSTDLAAGKWGAVAASGGDMLKSVYDPTNVVADAFDAANHSYLPAGTGAAAQGLSGYLDQTIWATSFGADPTGTTDSAAAINAAILHVNSLGGGTVRLPAGTFKIADTINLPYDNVALQGAHVEATKIVPAFTAIKNAIEVTGHGYNRVADLSIRGDADSTGNVAAGICLDDTYRTSLERLNIEHCAVNIFLKNGGTTFCYAPTLRDIRTNYGSIGLQIGDTTTTSMWQGVYMYNCTFGAATDCGVIIYAVGGLIWQGGECIYNSTSVKVRPGVGQNINGGFISGVWFDDNTLAGIDADITLGAGGGGTFRDFAFTNCSFNFSQGGAGFVLNGHTTGDAGVSTITFSNCRWVINAKQGMYVQYVTLIEFNGCSFIGNGTEAPNTHNGLDIGPGCTNVRFIGGAVGTTTEFAATQKYGINVEPSCWNVVVLGTDLTGNVTGGLLDNSSNQFQSGYLVT